MTVHTFRNDLATSAVVSKDDWWDSFYRSYFPKLVGHHVNENDGWAQRAGIDRTLVLEDMTHITVDEKVRSTYYADVLLEVWSDVGRRTPSWLTHALTCDYIAYVWWDCKQGLLLPYQELRRAWYRNGADWQAAATASRDGFRWADADNGRYTTRSLAVPTQVLLDAMTDSLRYEAV